MAGVLCGQVSYEAQVDPARVAICHCSDCQTHSGTAFGVIVAVVGAGFRLTSGRLKTFEKIAKSGRVRALAFCPDCGTRIHASTPGDAEAFFGLRVDTVRQRARLVPRVQVWCRSAQPWVAGLEDIPKRQGQDA